MDATNSINVRFATPADLDFVIQDNHITAEVAKRKIEWQEVIVAERNGEPAGYARLEYLWSQVPYLSMIRVIPVQQKHGIGTILLNFIEEYLLGKGCAMLYSSSQVDEPEPQAWHRHMGFAECGIINGINADGIGEVFFCKQLR